jgi:hypothetical protein
LADFQRILLGYEPEESFKSTEGKQLGLISEIGKYILDVTLTFISVTFDFGPLLAYNNHQYFSIFAVDSDGEVYYSACGTKADR